MGHVKWIWAERYLALTPERFWNQLSRIGPIRRGRKGRIKPECDTSSFGLRSDKTANPNELAEWQDDLYGTCSVPPPRVRWQMAPGADRGKNTRGAEAAGLRQQQN